MGLSNHKNGYSNTKCIDKVQYLGSGLAPKPIESPTSEGVSHNWAQIHNFTVVVDGLLVVALNMGTHQNNMGWLK